MHQTRDESGRRLSFLRRSMAQLNSYRLVQDLIIYCATGCATLVLWLVMEPYHRGFFCDDDSIRYQYLPDTVSATALMLGCILIPLLTIAITEIYQWRCKEKFSPKEEESRDTPSTTVEITEEDALVNRFDRDMFRQIFFQFFSYAGAFAFGFNICVLATFIGKITLGKLRPHFLDVCEPDWIQLEGCNHEYIIDNVCKGEASLIKEGRQSFPSGHASLSAYSAMFTVLYLQNRATCLRSPNKGFLLRPLIQYILFVMTFFTGLTRIADNHHDLVDVTAGWALGIFCAYAIWYHFQLLKK